MEYAKDEQGAVAFGEKLMKAGIICNITNEQEFKNGNVWYQFIEEININEKYKWMPKTAPKDLSGVPSQIKDPITNVCRL